MKPQKTQSKIRQFKTRAEEAAWWDSHDVTDYLDELQPVQVTFNLEEPKEETVVLRLHKGIKDSLTRVARTKGLNVSSLLRMWVMEKLQTLQ